jgi:uncharacterized protein (TIGR02145 family)
MMPTTSILRSGLCMAGLAFLAACGTDSTSFMERDAGAFSASLIGKVSDRDGHALAGALVVATPGGKTTVTGPDGKFELAAMPAGAYRVAAAREDYRDTGLTDSIRLGLLDNRQLPVLGMKYRYATILGTVTDSNGIALVGAGVAIQNQTAQTLSAEGGAYALGRVEPGRIKLYTALSGIGYGALDTVLGPQDTLHALGLRIARKGGTVGGRVVDGSLVPLAGATVTALDGALKATTDRNGLFTLGQVPSVGAVGLIVDRNGIRQSVSGVRVGEGARVDLESIAPGAPLSGNEGVSVSNGLVFAYTSDSLLTVVADTAGRDTSFHILRWLWSRDGLKSWDTTSTNVWKRSLSVLGWGVGDHQIQVCAYSMNGVLTSAVAQTVRVRLPPDVVPPLATRIFPQGDTTFLWRDSLVAVAWSVADDRQLETVLINGNPVAAVAGNFSLPVRLTTGANLVVLRAMDHVGNVKFDTLRLKLGTRGAYDSSLKTLKVTTSSGWVMSNALAPSIAVFDTASWMDTAITVKATAGDSLDTVLIGAVVANQRTLPLGLAGSTTLVNVQVRAFDGDTLDYVIHVFRTAFDTGYGIPWKSGISFGRLDDARDGQSYRTVKIGGREWMAQNLSHSGGGAVGTCYNAALGATGSGPADTCAKYGRLYTWAEAMGAAKGFNSVSLAPPQSPRGLCPIGWHVLSNVEWRDLLAATVGPVGTKPPTDPALLRSLKGWNAGGDGQDTAGLRILPAGEWVEGSFGGLGDRAYFWTSTETAPGFASDRYLSGNPSQMGSLQCNKSSAISLRCVKDLPPSYDTTLSALSVKSSSGDSLTGFDPTVQSYNLNLKASDTTIAVAVVASDSTATVTIGAAVGGKRTIRLNPVGIVTTVAIRVKGLDGDVLTYTLNVLRNAFDSSYGIAWNPAVTFGTLLDTRDSQTYRTVAVGKQVWMAQNLAYSVDSSWCPDGSPDSCAKYGRLYSWSAARGLSPAYDSIQWYGDSLGIHQGVCPTGWHLPSAREWTYLTDTVLVSASAGISLKSLAGWDFIGNGSDSPGLRILPAGARSTAGTYSSTGASADFWTGDQSGASYAVDRSLSYYGPTVLTSAYISKMTGASVRCIGN